jgi:hypothetical protein
MHISALVLLICFSLTNNLQLKPFIFLMLLITATIKGDETMANKRILCDKTELVLDHCWQEESGYNEPDLRPNNQHYP